MALDKQLQRLSEHYENCNGILQIHKKYLDQSRSQPVAFTSSFPSRDLKRPERVEALKSSLTDELTEAMILKLWAAFERILFDLFSNAKGEIGQHLQKMKPQSLSVYYRQREKFVVENADRVSQVLDLIFTDPKDELGIKIKKLNEYRSYIVHGKRNFSRSRFDGHVQNPAALGLDFFDMHQAMEETLRRIHT